MSRRRSWALNYSLSPLGPGTTPAKTAHIAFVKMVLTFEQIDQEMLYEMEEDIKRCIQPSDELHPEPWSSSRFSDAQVHKDKGVEAIKQSVSHTQSEAETLRYLADTTCLKAWSWVYQVLLVYQGHSNDYHLIKWSHAKSQANKTLNFAQAVLQIYESEVCQNLIINGHEDIGVGVELKLRALLSFDDIYGRATFEESKATYHPPHHHFGAPFHRFVSRRSHKINLSNKEAIARTHQDVSPRLG